MDRATISFPVPLSPRINTEFGEHSLGDRPVGLLHFRRAPTILPNPSFDLIFSRGMRFSVFILKWVATRFSRSFSSSMGEGLSNVVVGAVVHGLHRRLYDGVTGHNHDLSAGTGLLDLVQWL
jgi:hypothetical protein